MTETGKEEWPYPGARWWKFDFHTHTPASRDTDAWQRAIGTPEAMTPEKWLLKYMAAEIDCVAVTDHNSGEWINQLKTAYAAMQANQPDGFRELFLFPGVEISVNGGFHLLAIFDGSATTGDIDTLLGGVDYAGTKGDSNGVTRRSAEDVIQAVLDAGALPIPAHVEGCKGLLKAKVGLKPALDHHTLVQVLNNPGMLAMEVLNPAADKPLAYSQAKRKWAEVIGSDCHSFEERTKVPGESKVPGSRYTWIKMAAPSLEGLRLALLDGQHVSVRRSDDRGTFLPFDKPAHFIENIEISEARYMGRRKPARFVFNPCFNALVGGRGTGKSTVVHALRLAYRREGELGSTGEAGETFARFTKVARNRNDMVGGLLPDTQITLTLRREGIRYQLFWPKNERDAVVQEWDEAASQWKDSSASQTVSEQRFPVRLYSQGQIAALAGESQQNLLQVIDEAAQTHVAQQALEEAGRAFFATRAKQREVSGKLKGRDALDLGLHDVQRKLARFEAAHHADVLKAYQRTSRQTREMTRQFDAAAAMAARLHQVSADLLAEDLPDALFDPVADTGALSVVQQLAQTVAQAKAQVEAAAQLLAEKGASLRAQLAHSEWQERVAQSAQAYQALKADLLTQGVSDPSEYGRLVQERQRLETEIKRLDALQKQFDELDQHAKKQLDDVWEARRRVSEVRRAFLQQSVANNPFVHVTLIPYGRDAKVLARSFSHVLRKLEFGLYEDEEGEIPVRGLIKDMLMEVELFHKNKLDTPQFEEYIRQLKGVLGNPARGENELDAWFKKDAAWLHKRLIEVAEKRPEFIDHILCWFPEDSLKVEYSRKGDGKNFQPIGQASAGQRAAAMLAFLLAYGTEPLVLDQPEDDLDNHLIYDLVVQQIRANKQRRQLIIVTHNPNIVVNGDAEMIYALDFNSQCFISQSGSLQNQAMRDEVCSVMEGGEEAFDRRYQRLGRKV